ncbi:MAG TPA: hypothetical protein ENG87_00835, partial [Candidatus Pacearchaeota archaeon]|nr:hypothetical protein [Candidatus Pacearchaeota archaeon]
MRIGNSDESFQKHEVVKLLLVMKILRKYRRKDFLRIYTEFQLENNCKPDIYFENLKDKSILIYEIQKDYTKEWLKEKTKQYKDYEVYNFTVDFIPINLNLFSND